MNTATLYTSLDKRYVRDRERRAIINCLHSSRIVTGGAEKSPRGGLIIAGKPPSLDRP